MTKGDLVGSCLRRWYVVVLGLVLTVAAAVLVGLAPGVYWARTQVLLLGPPSESRPNKLDSNSAGLIATAGLIEHEMNIGRHPIPATSVDVTLLDQGVYNGDKFACRTTVANGQTTSINRFSTSKLPARVAQ